MVDTGGAPLTDAQREIMEVVWQRGEVTVSEVREALAARRDVARNTVQTMMVRLEERGWLKHREQGRTFYYAAAKAKASSLGVKVAQLIDRFFAGSLEEMVTALIEYRGLSQDESQRIRDMIEQAEKGGEADASDKNVGSTKRRKGKRS